MTLACCCASLIPSSLLILQGPNYLWSVDGHEKQAQPFGIYIYGVIDTFSRKILAIHVLPDKKKETVGNWLLSEICHVKGIKLMD